MNRSESGGSGRPPRVLQRRALGTGKWLRLDELAYVDAHGAERCWECCDRQQDRGAVLVVARLRPSGRFILVQQYRPPADATVLEFPAGLIDKDETPEQAALRELKEETGYRGIVCGVSPFAFSTPGLSSEVAAIVQIDVDEADGVNTMPSPAPDDGEHVDTVLLAPGDFALLQVECARKGIRLDIKVLAWFLSLCGQAG